MQVYYGMNLLQQFIIRRIGASLFAMCTALRLVASIAGDTHNLTPYALPHLLKST